MTPGITVATPTIPPRRDMLTRAVASVLAQTHPAAGLSIAVDLQRAGAAATRTRALHGVRTEWVAFLDDDDELMPQHLQRLWAHAQDTGADYVFSWFEIPQSPGYDPLNNFGVAFDYADPKQTTVTTLVRTGLAMEVGGFLGPLTGAEVAPGQVWGEDYQFTLRCRDAGAIISHLPERTWYWHHHGANTSGQPTRW